jgi:transposase-like protein
VQKADQITESITSLISSYSGTNKNLLTLKVNYQFADSSMKNITEYLIQSHTPKITEATNEKFADQVNSEIETGKPEQKLVKQVEANPLASNPAMTCSKCQSENLEVTYGKYGYYFKCSDCDGNTAIRLECKNSSCKPRIKKQKNTFYKVCETCGTSELYFTNQLAEEAQ